MLVFASDEADTSDVALNRLPPPFSSPSSAGTSGMGLPRSCASLERSFDDARADTAVELLRARCTSSTLADAERGFELARLLGVVGRRAWRPSVYDTWRGTGGRLLKLEEVEGDPEGATCIEISRP